MSDQPTDRGPAPDPSAPPPLSTLRRRLRPVMVTIALGFVVYAAVDLSRRWDASRVLLRPGYLVLSLLPIAAAAMLQAWAWILLVDHLAGRRIPRAAALALYLDSQMARYTPGKVGLPLVRIAGAPLLGVSGALVGSSVLIEHLSWLAVGGTLGFASFAAASDGSGQVTALLGRFAVPATLGFVIATLVLLLVDRRRFPAFVQKLTGGLGQGPLLSLGTPFVHLLHWTMWGAHGVLLALGVGADLGAARAGFPVLILAPMAGFLALVAPAGAGVREAVLSMGLAPAVGAAPALVAAVAARVASLVADVSTWVVARAILRRVRGV